MSMLVESAVDTLPERSDSEETEDELINRTVKKPRRKYNRKRAKNGVNSFNLHFAHNGSGNYSCPKLMEWQIIKSKPYHIINGITTNSINEEPVSYGKEFMEPNNVDSFRSNSIESDTLFREFVNFEDGGLKTEKRQSFLKKEKIRSRQRSKERLTKKAYYSGYYYDGEEDDEDPNQIITFSRRDNDVFQNFHADESEELPDQLTIINSGNNDDCLVSNDALSDEYEVTTEIHMNLEEYRMNWGDIEVEDYDEINHGNFASIGISWV
ncbi:hypothetical protein KAFR_0E02610 [Kazachstania africana CBS 2517]|uniref:Uncharacterized protein n=1 Tax=Kazachstania africana (strain ATCC 22294 / BCRC 22015 / CBS 2517 / CECT 1963 / NBRC 1671 / NRRL Y-8276) TaxID=1071382 RepID=H2AVL4_KAZAF|nr:hypothetical protein KAFR_0E02610 [Kazachstania africana CBS 2517]CCF58414.1 hypothetical protein KAFR_0E02610 [Kazachstania africana CBS 2517]